MPNVTDIVALAEALEKSPVVVVGDRCVHVRNRNSSCNECVAVCTRDAITVRGNDITLDSGACCGCGACVPACPTEALVPAQASDEALFGQALRSAEANGGLAVIACARMAAKQVADPARIAEVPCLARVDETLVVRLAAAGAARVVLVDGTCSTCKYRACVEGADRVLDQARELLATFGSDAIASRSSEFPSEVVLDDTAGRFGSTRRGFFSDAANAAKDTALTAARTTMDKNFGPVDAVKPIGERLRVGANGAMPRLDMPRHTKAIDALDALLAFDPLDAPGNPAMKSRLFGSVSIDVENCNACGMCAVFCPAGALVRDPAEKLAAPVRYLEHTASSCVQCHLCADVCMKRCIAVDDTVALSRLFDFEPVTFPIQ